MGTSGLLIRNIVYISEKAAIVTHLIMKIQKQSGVCPLISKIKAYGYPTIKPFQIIENIIRNSSKKGDIILDPFIVFGMTAVAAIKNERRFIEFENNKNFYNIAFKKG